ncbi:alpha/beta fold hydrolase [Shinella zoogloeoides]|uniref:alpha/beta fold hydrolase n=1 Tax=Shinella zoogloeoides TaxID=352475 RepID=UPI00273DFB9A|nr:alpha/beta fold hydrolase [Shinella zoogloeoides]WLR95594.1 alpha/beta fold hydrolase [Shinella zoogloeoides]
MKLCQSILFCTSADGTRIAVASCGKGPVILRAAHWLSHVDYDLESPVWRPWLQALSARNRFVRYDPRGCGLSERHVADLSIEAWHADLDAVAASIDEPRFVLLGLSQGGALAIAYALRHPERVSHLVLLNAYGQGGRVRAQTAAERLEAETLVNFIRIGWGRENPAFCQFFTNLFIPDGTPEQHRWWGDLERVTATADVAAQLLWHMQGLDVLDLAAKIRVPTLILHSRGDMRVPFNEGCKLAAAIAGARFVPLQSTNHVLLPDEAAWAVFHAELAVFLGQDRPVPPRAIREAGLTPAEVAILNLVAEGLDNRAIADRLGKSVKTVRNQLSMIFSKLGVRSRSQAIVMTLSAGNDHLGSTS